MILSVVLTLDSLALYTLNEVGEVLVKCGLKPSQIGTWFLMLKSISCIKFFFY